MNIYLDQIKKLTFLRDRIAGAFTLQGVIPNRALVEQKLNEIDAKLSLAKYTPVEESTKFNTKDFNEFFQYIYEDLLIIHQLIYDIAKNKFGRTQAYIDTHLKELEQLAYRYQLKSSFETSATTIGKTVFFQSSGFAPKSKYGYVTYDLGKVQVSKGSTISFYVEGRGFDLSDVTFSLSDTIKGVPYKINSSTVKIPGEQTYTTYEYTIPNDIKITQGHALAPTGLEPNQSKKYIIFGGKNHVMAGKEFYQKPIKKEESTFLELLDPIGEVSFYLVGGSYVSFDFIKKPLSQNFSGTEVRADSSRKISFEYQGPFSFNYVTDGTIYATKHLGTVKSNSLFYPSVGNLRDFRIEEYSDQAIQEYNLQVTIKTLKDPFVEYMALREVSLSEVDS